jgi:hypothetical protein
MFRMYEDAVLANLKRRKPLRYQFVYFCKLQHIHKTILTIKFSGGFTRGTFARAQRVKGPLRADFRQPVMHE